MTSSTEDICLCCKADREAKDQLPRVLIPVSLHDMEKEYLLCGYCDGDAVVMAKQLERMRGDSDP